MNDKSKTCLNEKSENKISLGDRRIYEKVYSFFWLYNIYTNLKLDN